ncbi:MAG: 30S ribosomal protein S8 [Candidatus Tectomicrobia bacterium]|uniref:Small ribosomal subunit protein uS8 n=1 Tax=Tectimicrobiota bacterium TaxID=2528274 RepID=A0A932HWY6_UNCTE|nr:30S ribosomal protein S8 [Candidatus Tectomicrobia bacterium]
MSMTDPIADLLTRVRNAARAGHTRVEVPAGRMKGEILGILRAQGFIQSYDSKPGQGGQELLVISLKSPVKGKNPLNGLRRVSKPGRRVYVGKEDIPKVLNGMGIAILTTPKGILTDEEARAQGVGGEVICEIW